MPPLVAHFERLQQIQVSSGPTRTVKEGELVSLQGSTVPSGDDASINYLWSQLSGIPVSLQSANTLNAQFTAPMVNQARQLVFKLSASGDNILAATDTVVVHVLPAPAGEVFIDDFSGNSLDQYAIEQGDPEIQSPTIDWQSASENLHIYTGDNAAISLTKLVPASVTGILQLDFTPYRKYPVGARIAIRLLQDEYNYYEISNTDGYGPGRLSKTINGQLSSSAALPYDYFQQARHDINIYFSPDRLTVSGLTRTGSLSGSSSPINVNQISITFAQQDAYLDDIFYTTVGIPYIIAIGDSIIWGEGDLDLDDGIGFVPQLEDRLLASSGSHHAIFNEGVPGHKALQGAARIDEVLQRHPAADIVLLQYGSNDALETDTSGLGLGPNDPGYSISYKAHMQQMITSILAANKQLYIAKPPIMTAPYDGLNPLLLQYSQVIDELLLENQLVTLPPDFYCYFSMYPGQFTDSVHPSSAGHAAIASIWHNIILGTGNSCAP